MSKLAALVGALGLMAAGECHADTWQALAGASSDPSCKGPVGAYELTSTGTELAVKAPSGSTGRSTIAPDGAVKVQYASRDARFGDVTISGNARSKSLQLTATGFPGCAWNMSPLPAAKWRATVTIERGVPRNCGDVLRSMQTVEMVGQNFKSVSDNGVVWDFNTRALRADGSGRITVKNAKGVDVYWDFEAGHGPRAIHQTNANSECGYLWTPS